MWCPSTLEVSAAQLYLALPTAITTSYFLPEVRKVVFSFCANTSVSVIACNITEVRYVLIFKSKDALKNTKCLSSES